MHIEKKAVENINHQCMISCVCGYTSLFIWSRPGGVVASTFASHAEDQGSILVGSRSVTKPWCEW